MEKKYDAIVIGAGNGGLIAATVLASKKKKVLLVEKHNVPGGFASSFVRGRFEFETALHELCDLGTKKLPGRVFQLFEELEINVDWQLVPEAFRLIGEYENKKIDFVLPFGEEEFAQACEKYDKGSYKSVKKFITICAELKDAIKYLEISRGKPDTKVLKKSFPNYLTTAPYSLKEVLDGLKVPKLSQRIIEAYWPYLGVTSSKISFILYGIMFIEYIRFNAYIPKNRSHEISQSIANRFQELGGEIWFNTEVSEIIVENNSVKGIITNNGNAYTDHIISNASPHLVYGKLIKNDLVPQYDRNLANSRKPGKQGFSMYLGLNKSVEELGLTDYSYFMYGDCDENNQLERMKTIKSNNLYILIALNVANKSASDPKTSILSFTTIYTDENAWNDVNKKNYFNVKEYIANMQIDHFEKTMNIKIRDYIEEISIATPITFARYTNSVNGAIYGYDCTPQDSTLIRGSLMDEEVNIKGLRFAGGNSFRAHGYSTTYLSGETMAYKTLLDMAENAKTNKNLGKGK